MVGIGNVIAEGEGARILACKDVLDAVTLACTIEQTSTHVGMNEFFTIKTNTDVLTMILNIRKHIDDHKLNAPLNRKYSGPVKQNKNISIRKAIIIILT
jgi:hypothetical protein